MEDANYWSERGKSMIIEGNASAANLREEGASFFL